MMSWANHLGRLGQRRIVHRAPWRPRWPLQQQHRGVCIIHLQGRGKLSQLALLNRTAMGGLLWGGGQKKTSASREPCSVWGAVSTHHAPQPFILLVESLSTFKKSHVCSHTRTFAFTHGGVTPPTRGKGSKMMCFAQFFKRTFTQATSGQPLPWSTVPNQTSHGGLDQHKKQLNGQDALSGERSVRWHSTGK